MNCVGVTINEWVAVVVRLELANGRVNVEHHGKHRLGIDAQGGSLCHEDRTAHIDFQVTLAAAATAAATPTVENAAEPATAVVAAAAAAATRAVLSARALRLHDAPSV